MFYLYFLLETVCKLLQKLCQDVYYNLILFYNTNIKIPSSIDLEKLFTLYSHPLYLNKELKNVFEKLERGEEYFQEST